MSVRTKNLELCSPDELMEVERQIVRKYIGGLSWFMVLWPILNLSCWFLLWALVLSGKMSAFAAFPIALVNCILAYLPSHEAQHDIYGRPGDKTRWLNQAIGHLSPIPIALTYRFLRETHLEHHKYTNDPERDPDYKSNYGANVWQALYNIYLSIQPRSGGQSAYIECLERLDTQEARLAMRDQTFMVLAYFSFLFILAMNGHALTAALLWWLPLKIAVFYIRFYLSWVPHFPRAEQGRYKNTRSFKSWLGNISALGMTAHVVHHLHPRIPLDRTPAALRELYPVLRARGVDLPDL